MQNKFILRIGGEFLVNTVTANDQLYPSISKVNNQKLIVLWSSYNEDGSYFGIYGQFFDYYNNKIGNEFLVNSYTSNNQYIPCVAPINNGFISAWSSYGEDQSGWGVYFQFFDQNANKQGIEQLLNTYTIGDQGYANIAGLEISGRVRLVSTYDNNIIATWVSNGQDGSGGGIYYCILDKNGHKILSDAIANTYTSDWQILPQIGVFSDNSFVISWCSNGEDGSSWGIYMQLFDAQGKKYGYEMIVPSYVTLDQIVSSIAILANDNYVVVWDAYGEIGNGWEIKAQIFNKKGWKIGGDFFVNNYIQSDQKIPVVKSFLNGEFFIVAWQSYVQDGSDYGIYGRIFDNDGNQVSAEFKISIYSYAAQMFADIVVSDDSDYKNVKMMIVWQSSVQDGSGYGIFGQVFSFDMTDYVLNVSDQNIVAALVSNYTSISRKLIDVQKQITHLADTQVAENHKFKENITEISDAIIQLTEEYISIEKLLIGKNLTCISLNSEGN